MGDAAASIDEYLARYAASLTTFDAEAAADLWAWPGMILDDRSAGVLESRDAMIRGLEQAYPLYRQLGLASVEHELLREEPLSETITLVHVRWRFLGVDGAELTDSHSYYVVRRTDAGLRACVCIETDAAEKLRALAAEHGITLPS